MKSVREVLIHVQGDREAALDRMKQLHLEYRMISSSIWIKDCFISLDNYGEFGNRLCFEPVFAKGYAGKPVFRGWGDRYRPFDEQARIFEALKRAIMKHRAAYYVETEKRMQDKHQSRDEALRQVRRVIDFEKNIFNEEHQLEDQIKHTMDFISGLKEDFPKATFGKHVDCGVLDQHLGMLDDILEYLKHEEIQAVHLLRDATIHIKKQGRRLRIQKKHLKKISSRLSKFVREIRYFLRVWVKGFQITTVMRSHLKDFYGQILKTYGWYAELFKKEAGKPNT